MLKHRLFFSSIITKVNKSGVCQEAGSPHDKCGNAETLQKLGIVIYVTSLFLLLLLLFSDFAGYIGVDWSQLYL